jgi:hypothetical protein
MLLVGVVSVSAEMLCLHCACFWTSKKGSITLCRAFVIILNCFLNKCCENFLFLAYVGLLILCWKARCRSADHLCIGAVHDLCVWFNEILFFAWESTCLLVEPKKRFRMALRWWNTKAVIFTMLWLPHRRKGSSYPSKNVAMKVTDVAFDRISSDNALHRCGGFGGNRDVGRLRKRNNLCGVPQPIPAFWRELLLSVGMLGNTWNVVVILARLIILTQGYCKPVQS